MPSSRPPDLHSCTPTTKLPGINRARLKVQQQTQHPKDTADLWGNTCTREMCPGRPSTAASAASWDTLKLCLSVLAKPACSLLSWRLKDGRSGAPRASVSLFSSWLSSREGRLASLQSACKHLASFCLGQNLITWLSSSLPAGCNSAMASVGMTAYLHVTQGVVQSGMAWSWTNTGTGNACTKPGLPGQGSEQPVDIRRAQHLELPLMGCPGHDAHGVPAGVWEELGTHISCSPMSACHSIPHRCSCCIAPLHQMLGLPARAAPVCSIASSFTLSPGRINACTGWVCVCACQPRPMPGMTPHSGACLRC